MWLLRTWQNFNVTQISFEIFKSGLNSLEDSKTSSFIEREIKSVVSSVQYPLDVSLFVSGILELITLQHLSPPPSPFLQESSQIHSSFYLLFQSIYTARHYNRHGDKMVKSIDTVFDIVELTAQLHFISLYCHLQIFKFFF